MIMIHRGKGAAVVFIGGIVSALIMNIITNAMFNNDYYGSHIWPRFGTLWLAGVIFTAAGIYLRKHPTIVKDKDWVEGESADHFFFIPVLYWGPIFFVLGVVFAAYSFYSQTTPIK
ncbi:hypothetical protein BH10ACI3_BH10ACI3_14790 [soil metagenome]